YTHTHTTRVEISLKIIWYQSQVHQNLSCSFRTTQALPSAQIQPLKTFPSEFSFSMRRRLKGVSLILSPVYTDGETHWKQKCMERTHEPHPRRLLQELSSPDLKKGGVFELEKQEGGHELKE
ncbi:hypothetical protein IGI04_042624, partial [Brassica rapa subsp. trilocularis]